MAANEPYRDNNDIPLKAVSKVDAHDNSGTPSYDEHHEAGHGQWGDTSHDIRDMLRMGKKQEFKRNFSFLSAIGFVSVYMATWEYAILSTSFDRTLSLIAIVDI